ncbi:MAG: hypothetical protein J1F06_06045 [Prevotellaceae bacterium]|nr:hypothetical protein [Prevotellaceae bacterium]
MNLRSLFLYCLLPFCCVAGFAQNLSMLLPAQFERVEQMEQVKNGGLFLIGCNIEGRYFFLSNTYNASVKRLRGYASAEYPSARVVRNDYSLVWHLRPQADGTMLIARPDSAAALSRNGYTGLQVSQTDTIHYQLRPGNETGTFSFFCQNRFLSVVLNVPVAYFFQSSANYPHSFELYRIREGYAGWEDSYVPEQDGRVALLAGGAAIGVQQNLLPVSDYLLSDGSLAYDDAFARYDLRWNENGTFALTDAEGEFVAGIRAFMLSDGAICSSDNLASRLVFDTEHRNLLLWEFGMDIPVSSLAAVSLSAVGEPPSADIVDGVKILHGSWTASALAATDWSTFCNLDLSQIHLPLQNEPFSGRPTTSNAIIYVDENEKDCVPTTWLFVVLTSEKGNRLFRSAELTDGEPLLVDRSFSVQKGQITYRRIDKYGDGGWETICLLFTINTSNSLTCETVESFDEVEGTLTFARCEQLQAHTPALIRFDNVAYFDFTPSIEQVIVPPATSASTNFVGTYKPLSIQFSDNLYLLNSAGTAFRRADTGSRLAPFRAYLSGGVEYKVRHRYSPK